MSSRMRRVVWELRTEGAGPAREAAAVGLGVFIGCSPLFGFHLVMCWAAGWCLRLNRLKMYLAANISNPLFAPVIILAELQTGAWVRRRELHALTLETVRTTDPWTFGADLIVGSIVVGLVLGLTLGTATYFLSRATGGDVWFAALVRRAADRYVATSITAWEFARGKLKGDPVYRTVLERGLLPPGRTLVDVGCGQGLMLALLVEAAGEWNAGRWRDGWPAPPLFETLIGIETRPRVAAMARRALGDSATIVAGDAREVAPHQADAMLFFDVLHMIPRDDQDRLLAAMAASLTPHGRVLVREPDAAAGWRFTAVRVGNTLKAIVTGNWRQRFHFRTVAGWIECFEHAGFEVAPQPAGDGTPFANVLFVLALSARDRASV